MKDKVSAAEVAGAMGVAEVKMNDIYKQLDQRLDEKLISTRKTSWGEVDYLPGHVAISQANKLFGYGNWSSFVMKGPESVKAEGKDCWYAIVRVVVRWPDGHDNHHDGIGYGDGDMEKAVKTAETDALKRALRHWGAQFGNSLYEGEQRENVKQQEGPAPRVPSPETKQEVEVKYIGPNESMGRGYDVRFITAAGEEAELWHPANIPDIEDLQALLPFKCVIHTKQSRSGRIYINRLVLLTADKRPAP